MRTRHADLSARATDAAGAGEEAEGELVGVEAEVALHALEPEQALEGGTLEAVDLGLAMIEVAREESGAGIDLRLRVGVHSGPVIGGVIGHDKFAFDIWGETVNVASRLESQGMAGRVHVSDTTWAAVADAFAGEQRGPIELRGHGRMETYAIIRRRQEGDGRGGRI